jgi:hypothetical protein
MPIYSVGNDGNKEIVFGTGDIKVSSGWSNDDNSIGVLTLNQQYPEPVGTETLHNPHEMVNYGVVPVRMVFHKVESVDVVIKHLEKVKKFMINNL